MIERIEAVYLSAPYVIFGAPLLFLVFIVLFSFIFQLIDMGDFEIEVEPDANTGFFGSIFITSGISKVPLMLGMTITLFFAHLFLYVLHNLALFAFGLKVFDLPSMIAYPLELVATVGAWILSPFIFYKSLFVAGRVCHPLAVLMKERVRLKPLTIIGSTGYTTFAIEGDEQTMVSLSKEDCVDHKQVVSHGGSRIESNRLVKVVAERDDGVCEVVLVE